MIWFFDLNPVRELHVSLRLSVSYFLKLTKKSQYYQTNEVMYHK